MKIYMIVLDGAADRKIKILGNKTPLEKAKTPTLDKLARNGQEAMIEVIGEQITPESDSGAMALLSYEPTIYYPGRGTLEGLGTGLIPEGYHYAAFRVNFASYHQEESKLDRRTARDLSDEELQKLAEEINEKVDLSKYEVNFKLLAFGYHRGILCFYSKEKQLSGNVSNTDPGFKKVKVWGYPVSEYEKKPLICYPLDEEESSKLTANIINEFEKQTHRILTNAKVNKDRIIKGKMPANYILVRDGGTKPKEMPKFKEKFGFSLSMYGQLPAEKAIANLIGANFTFSKSLDLQLNKEFLKNSAKKLIEDKADVVFMHIKGPDEPGHDNEPLKKVEAIELIDQYFLGNLLKGIRKEDIVIVTCDHATPCELKLHASDKVPIVISGANFEKDGSQRLDEETAQNGKCKVEKATDIFPYIVKKIGIKIEKINFRHILNSAGKITWEAEMIDSEGRKAFASSPSAIIPGKREVRTTKELDEYGMKKLIKEISHTWIENQERLDTILNRYMDKLGSDICLSLSLAFAKLMAQKQKVSLVEYIAQIANYKTENRMPKPLVAIFSGGKAHNDKDSIQNIMISVNIEPFSKAMKPILEIYANVENELKQRNLLKGYAASSGMIVEDMSTEEKFETVLNTIKKLGYQKKVTLATDVAAEHLFNNEMYAYEGEKRSAEQLKEIITKYKNKYDLTYIEDPFAPSDEKWWREMKEENPEIAIVGDDLFATQKKYIDTNLANGMVIKMNQVGTLTGTIHTFMKAKKENMRTCVSHRSIETEETFMCDLAIALDADYIKIGGPRRGDRIIKYNRLLRLEEI